MNFKTMLIMVTLLIFSTLSYGESTTKKIIAETNKGGYPGYVIYATSETLTLKKGNEKMQFPMPQDQFYLSIAPYMYNTHPCATHYVSSCQSEMRNRSFMVKVTSAEGEIILKENLTSLKNGFIDLWLPRNLEGAILLVEYKNKSVTTKISTRKGDPTCLTRPLKLN